MQTFMADKLTMGIVPEFNEHRKKINEVILKNNNLVMKCLWNLDTNNYEGGGIG